MKRAKSKQRQPKKNRKRARQTRKIQRTPKTAKDLFSMSRQFQERWNRVVQIPSEMRSRKTTLGQTSRLFGVNPKDVLRLAGPAFKEDRKGKIVVRRTDRLLRVLLIPSPKGMREIVVRDSREASLVGEFWSAAEKYLSRGDESALKNLPRKRVKDATGKFVRLLTNLDELRRLASAGVLQFESLYGRTN
jgi:hypothetical protein